MTTLKNENKSYFKEFILDEKKNNEIFEVKKAKALHIAKIASKTKN